MSVQDLFYLNQLRYEIAMHRSLKQWQAGPVIYGAVCPHCSSANYKKYCVENGKQRYRCQDCKRRFNERPQFECHCEIPGKKPQCHDCPGFQVFLKILQQHSDSLRHRTIEELEQLTNQSRD
jgi:DNA-directed RNA polymerase subunit RPC12/RpoP